MDIFDYIFIFLIGVFFAISYSLGFTPLLLPIVFVLSSIATFLLYAKDKAAAKKGEWRTAENTFHLFSLLCGWPGALLAQKKFRHKTRKVSFQITFWFTVLANISLMAWFHSPNGSGALKAYVWQLSNIVVSGLGENRISELLLFCLQYNAITQDNKKVFLSLPVIILRNQRSTFSAFPSAPGTVACKFTPTLYTPPETMELLK